MTKPDGQLPARFVQVIDCARLFRCPGFFNTFLVTVSLRPHPSNCQPLRRSRSTQPSVLVLSGPVRPSTDSRAFERPGSPASDGALLTSNIDALDHRRASGPRARARHLHGELARAFRRYPYDDRLVPLHGHMNGGRLGPVREPRLAGIIKP